MCTLINIPKAEVNGIVEKAPREHDNEERGARSIDMADLGQFGTSVRAGAEEDIDPSAPTATAHTRRTPRAGARNHNVNPIHAPKTTTPDTTPLPPSAPEPESTTTTTSARQPRTRASRFKASIPSVKRGPGPKPKVTGYSHRRVPFLDLDPV